MTNYFLPQIDHDGAFITWTLKGFKGNYKDILNNKKYKIQNGILSLVFRIVVVLAFLAIMGLLECLNFKYL